LRDIPRVVVIGRPTPSVVANPLLFLTLCSLRNGPNRVSLADTIDVQRSTAERPAPAKTDQARIGLHPFVGDGDDDYGTIFIIFGFNFLEALIIKILVLCGCDVMCCGLWETMLRKTLLPTSSG
jgi:hypothetical protein